MLTIKKRDNNYYDTKGSKITLKDIKHLILSGEDVSIINPTLEIDETKETLIRIILGDVGVEPTLSLISKLSYIIDSDSVLKILQNGGMDNYIARLKRGFIC